MFRFLFFKRKRIHERRKHPRKSTHNLAAIETPNRQLLNLNDISEGGAQLTSYSPFDQNQDVELTVNLAELNVQIPVSGKVVWRKGFMNGGVKLYHFGIMFTRMSQESSQIIRRFVQRSSLRAA